MLINFCRLQTCLLVSVIGHGARQTRKTCLTLTLVTLEDYVTHSNIYTETFDSSMQCFVCMAKTVKISW